jgi:hypothetical protein
MLKQPFPGWDERQRRRSAVSRRCGESDPTAGTDLKRTFDAPEQCYEWPNGRNLPEAV